MTKVLFTGLFCFSSLAGFPQRVFTIKDFISSSKNSIENSKRLKYSTINQNENDLFNKNFLPDVDLNFTFPSYNRSISEVTQPDGSYAFRENNSANSKVGLSVSQKIPFTGGKLTISNSLNRLDLFGDTQKKTSYSASWLGISLSQPLNFFNAMKWDKKIQEAKFEYNTMVNIKNGIATKKKTIKHYFELLRIKNEENLIAKRIEVTNAYKKYIVNLIKAGRAMAYDSIDVELKLLNEQKNLRFLDKSKNLKTQSVNAFFKEELIGKKDSLEIPTTNISLKELTFYRDKYIDLYSIIEKNNLLSHEKNIKQLEKGRFYAATLSVGVGFNNTSDKYTNIFQNPNESQNFSIALNFPVLDFGKKHTELELARTQYDIEILNLEQEKTLNTERISLLYEEINDLRYSLTLENSKTNLLRVKLKRMETLLYAQKILFQDYAETEDLLSKSLSEKINLTQNIYNKVLELEEITLTEII